MLNLHEGVLMFDCAEPDYFVFAQSTDLTCAYTLKKVLGVGRHGNNVFDRHLGLAAFDVGGEPLRVAQ